MMAAQPLGDEEPIPLARLLAVSRFWSTCRSPLGRTLFASYL